MCNEVVGVDDGIYDHKYYMRKHNMVIDFLGDEIEWKDTLFDTEIPETQKVSIVLNSVNYLLDGKFHN